MSQYIIKSVTDAGRTWLNGNNAEKVSELAYATLGEAIKEYEKYQDHGFAGWERVVSIISPEGEVIVTKTFQVPTA